MLSDSQIDDLEKHIFLAHRADLPLVLGKWLPVLFTELRLARAALDKDAALFLGGAGNDSGSALSNPGAYPEGDGQGLRLGHEHLGSAEEVFEVAEEGSVSADPPVSAGPRTRRGKGKRPKPRRNRATAGDYEGLVVGPGVQQPLGGESGEPARGGEPDAVEDVSPLNRQCSRCGTVRGAFGSCERCGSPEFSLTSALVGQMALPLEPRGGGE